MAFKSAYLAVAICYLDFHTFLDFCFLSFDLLISDKVMFIHHLFIIALIYKWCFWSQCIVTYSSDMFFLTAIIWFRLIRGMYNFNAIQYFPIWLYTVIFQTFPVDLTASIKIRFYVGDNDWLIDWLHRIADRFLCVIYVFFSQ